VTYLGRPPTLEEIQKKCEREKTCKQKRVEEKVEEREEEEAEVSMYHNTFTIMLQVIIEFLI
jgi:hypothetical protein